MKLMQPAPSTFCSSSGESYWSPATMHNALCKYCRHGHITRIAKKQVF